MNSQQRETMILLEKKVKALTSIVQRQNKQIGEMTREKAKMNKAFEDYMGEISGLKKENEDLKKYIEMLKGNDGKNSFSFESSKTKTKEDSSEKTIPKDFEHRKTITKKLNDRITHSNGKTKEKALIDPKTMIKGVNRMVKTVMSDDDEIDEKDFKKNHLIAFKRKVEQLKELSMKSNKKVKKLGNDRLAQEKLIGLRYEFEHLIIDFMQLGVDSNKLGSFIAKDKLEFQFSSLINKAIDIKFCKEITKFFIPFVLKPKIITIEDSFEKLNKILLTENSANEFFCISLNSDNITDQFSNVPELLQKSNSNLFYQYYCLKTTDFVVTQDNKGNTFDIILIPKFYIIKTFYSFSLMFRDILIQYLHSIRRFKMEKFMSFFENKQIDIKELIKIDYKGVSHVEKKFAKELEQSLNQLNMIDLKKSEIRVVNDNFAVDYKIPQDSYLPMLEAEHCFKRIFKKLSLEDFLLVYTAIIHEKHVLFISDYVSETTAALTSFLTLIKPFKWPLPIIYNTPEELLQMLGSPIPLLAGINTSPKKFIEEILPQYDSETWVYVFVDQGFVYTNDSLVRELCLPQFGNFVNKIKSFYHQWFNKKTSLYYKISHKGARENSIYKLRIKKTKSLRNSLKKVAGEQIRSKTKNCDSIVVENDVDECLGIFRLFEELHNSFIIQNFSKKENSLSNSQSFGRNGEHDFSTFSSNKGDIEFLKSFSSKQSFIYFFENENEKKGEKLDL